MLVRVNKIIDNVKVTVTKLDIEDDGSITTLENLELDLPSTDDSIIEILKNSQYACIFTSRSTNTINENEGKNTVIIANAMTAEELAHEQRKTIDAVRMRRK
ncbi:MAG TPA: hypothetical protein VH500_19540 [Nitrososphaeraceae archaeon]|jgi:hypothetical protein